MGLLLVCTTIIILIRKLCGFRGSPRCKSGYDVPDSPYGHGYTSFGVMYGISPIDMLHWV